MKIHRLEIRHIRGIPKLIIEPKGNSFVIYGSNGSGKSAVIDALDFLLKGEIDRLKGKGTEGISLKDHGPHINKTAEPEKAEVLADISLHGSDEIFTISRNLRDKELIYEEKYKEQIEPLVKQLSRGQHVFTRREILKLITSPSKDRSDEILSILKLEKVEQSRKVAVSVHGEAKRAVNEAIPHLVTAKNVVLAITESSSYKVEEVLQFVNELRATLKVLELKELEAKKIKEGVQEDKQLGATISHDEIDQRKTSLTESTSVENLGEYVKTVDDLEKTLKEIATDEQDAWNSKRIDLTQDGLRMIRESGECPLCDEEWEEGELRKYLEDRIEQQSGRQEELNQSTGVIKAVCVAVITNINEFSSVLGSIAKTDKFKNDAQIAENVTIIKHWKERIDGLLKDVGSPSKDYKEKGYDVEEVKYLFATNQVGEAISQICERVKELFPEATPEQAALAKLIRLEERLGAVEKAQAALDKANIFLRRAKEFEEKYTEAKDEVLNGLYEEVKDSFVILYREMHAPDESGFEAELTPMKAGLKFKVDFFGKGYHPPHAMHSEGHQDSMGVCLFLALAEKLNKGIIDLSILDDVVMSVDSGHRQAFCSVLKTHFPHKQFIITTHDTTWATQLQKQRVVTSQQMLRLYGWTVDTGPLSNYAADVWERIAKDMAEENINEAAAKLRRGLEEWARMICGNLRASVPYVPNDGGGLGDFMPPALKKYRDLLKEAKNAAASWGKTELVEQYEEQLSVFDQIRDRTSVEQWMINPAVHYNEWENFTKDEFQNVVDAFRDMTDLFNCTRLECGMAIIAEYKDFPQPATVSCGCGDITWSLKRKS